MLIDLHADTPLLMHWAGYDFCAPHRPWLPAGAWCSNVDLPRMQQAGLDAQVFGLVALPFEDDPYGTINGMIDAMEAAASRARDAFALVRSASALKAARAQGTRVGLLSIEGVHCLQGRLERADALIERGVVSFGLCHFHANAACRPAKGLGRRDDAGLTDFGKALVQHLGSRGVLVDLTHINRAGFFDALAVSQGPMLVTHTGVSGVYSHWRNLDDAQIRAIADRGGVVGIIFSRHFLGGSDMDAVVRHILHVIQVGGIATAALGSDFDGFVVPVRGLQDVTGLPALREALGRAGLASREVDAVLGRNALELLERALG